MPRGNIGIGDRAGSTLLLSQTSTGAGVGHRWICHRAAILLFFNYDTEGLRVLGFDVVHISYTHHISSWVYSKQQSQSTSIPFPLNSFLAISISPISSLYASGTSLNVNTPQPNLNSRYAPKETRAQNGNCWSVELAERLLGM